MPSKVTRSAAFRSAHAHHGRGPRFRGGWAPDVVYVEPDCVDEYGRPVDSDERELVTIGALPTTMRGGVASARMRARANPPHPFDHLWPDYTPGDARRRRAADRRDDAPWGRRPNAGVGLAPKPRRDGVVTMGAFSFSDPLAIFEQFTNATAWGTVALAAVVSGAAGFGLGMMVGSSEVSKAIGRHVSAGVGTVTQHAATHLGKHVIPALMEGA